MANDPTDTKPLGDNNEARIFWNDVRERVARNECDLYKSIVARVRASTHPTRLNAHSDFETTIASLPVRSNRV
jgi:hypothetical protein